MSLNEEASTKVAKDQGHLSSITHVKCPLCGTREWEKVAVRTGSQLHLLWNELGIDLPWRSFGGLAPDTEVSLLRCGQCGCEFFDPRFAGDGEFYRALEHPAYYCPHRPEFQRTRDFAARHAVRRVLDVGCGDGSFLDLMRETGTETHGLELNDSAAGRAEARGHTIHRKLLDQVDLSESGGKFDLITIFQVLEHVPEPVRIMQDAHRLLAPNGRIAVSVPSDVGILRLCPDDPHQWPPHHVTRWRPADLKQLGQASGLVLDKSGGDPLFATDVELFLKLRHRLSSTLGNPTLTWAPELIAGAAWLFRILGLKHALSQSGVSLYGYYRTA